MGIEGSVYLESMLTDPSIPTLLCVDRPVLQEWAQTRKQTPNLRVFKA